MEEIWQDFKVEIVETLQTSNFKAKCNVHISISRIGIWKSIIEVKMTNLPRQMLQCVHYIFYCASIKVLEVQLQMKNINVLVVQALKVDSNLWFVELESWTLATKWSTMNLDSRFICNLLQTPPPQCMCFLLEVGYNNEHCTSLNLNPFSRHNDDGDGLLKYTWKAIETKWHLIENEGSSFLELGKDLAKTHDGD